MKPEDRKELKKKIEAELLKVEQDIVDLTELSKPIPPENAIGRISRMEAINSRSVSEAALRKAKSKQSNLQVAIAKVDKPDFGICSMCKNPIQPARLMYMPESNRCVRCADR